MAGRLTTVTEVSIRLLDLLPLHSHFGALPGDEKVGPGGTRWDPVGPDKTTWEVTEVTVDWRILEEWSVRSLHSQSIWAQPA